MYVIALDKDISSRYILGVVVFHLLPFFCSLVLYLPRQVLSSFIDPGVFFSNPGYKELKLMCVFLFTSKELFLFKCFVRECRTCALLVTLLKGGG